MSYAALRKEIAELQRQLPKGYKTYDSNGQVAVQSELDGLAWFAWAMELAESPGREQEKALLGSQLNRSTGDDNGGGRIYELFLALLRGQKGRKPLDIESKAHSKRRVQRRTRRAGTLKGTNE